MTRVRKATSIKYATLIWAVLFFHTLALYGSRQDENIFSQMHLRGYVKEMPGIRLDRNFSDANFENLIHQRLNYRWNMHRNVQFVAESRHRIFYNSLFEDFPLFAHMLDQDDGLVDLSWVWMDEGSWIGHSEFDRLYLDFRHNNWQVRAGRQRINWGINLVSNPNDLFNTYSFFDFDYEERPGSDAIRVQYHTGFAGRLEVACSPAKETRNSVGAFLYATNYRGYDIQAIAGYFRNRSALGVGWAGNIGGAGFKGEATWFYDLEKTNGKQKNNLVAAAGVDYMFPQGTFAILEALYNGGFEPFDNMMIMWDQTMSPDNIMFSEYAVTASIQHPFSPVFNAGLALMTLPDQEAFFVSPQASWSLFTNLDLEIISQIFTGGKDSVFREAGSAWFMSLKYSF